MKIHIVGCSGSGKTYLSRALSEKFGIPHFDLDDIHWDNSGTYGVKRPVAERAELLDEILKNNDWIIEGVYYSWVGKCFEAADIIYVFDIPRRIYLFRIIKRFIRRKLRLEKGKKETLKSVIKLLKWTDTFQNVNMREIQKILEPHTDKTVWLTSSSDVKRIVGE